ncbi:F-box only protein 4-like [Diadema antillarum]|uniref:F-box only protein 4-like n=1 Tax=Diadema antillarum TaxID=105358 RepID=UPI003A83E33B
MDHHTVGPDGVDGPGLVEVGSVPEPRPGHSAQMGDQAMMAVGDDGDEMSATSTQPECDNLCDGDTEDTTLLNIPVYAFLHMLQFLDAKDICNLSATCRQFHSFCNDQMLWKSVLDKDMVKWSEVSNGTYPSNYTAQGQEVDYKDVYMRCNPELQKEPAFNLSSIPRLLWSFLPSRQSPIFIMFGPGLETDTSTIVRKLISGQGSSIIKVNGVFPAMYPGSVGTGFELTVNKKNRFRLVVLYSATRKERESRGDDQPRVSKLIKRVSPVPDDTNNEGAVHGAAGPDLHGEDFMNYEPNDHVKSMCRVVGGFVFVVDASQKLKKGYCSASRPELFAFMDPKWTSERKPLLVLSSIAEAETPRVPCVKMADQLSLQKLQRPWKVVDCEVDSLNGLTEGVDWLMGQAQRV